METVKCKATCANFRDVFHKDVKYFRMMIKQKSIDMIKST